MMTEHEGRRGGKKTQKKMISASDIEKFGYCPLSWYLSYKQRLEEGPLDQEDPEEKKEETQKKEKPEKTEKALEKGKEAHKEAGIDLESIMKKQGQIESTRISWIAFVAISVLVAINGGLILALIIYEQDNEIVSRILAATSLLWIFISIYYFISLILTERRLKWPFLGLLRFMMSKPKIRPQTAKEYKKKMEFFKMAVIMMIIAGVLLFNVAIHYRDIDKQIAQNILIVIALVWMLASSIILFFTLRKGEHIALYKNKLLIGFTLVAFIFASNAFIINRLDVIKGAETVTLVFGIIAVIWLLLSLFFLNVAFSESFRIHHNIKRLLKKKTKIVSTLLQKLGPEDIEERVKRHEKGVLYFGVISIFLGLNSFIVGINPNIDIAYILEIVALIWLLAALFLMFINLTTQREMFRLKDLYKIGKKTKVSYADTESEGKKKAKLFKSKQLSISGRPDLIIEEKGEKIPVEIKTGRVPKGPFFSHILQLAAYGLVLEEEYGKRPPHGLIKYGPKGDEEEFKVDLDDDLMKLLKEKIDLIRKGMDTGDVHRNHRREGKCRSCSRRKDCPESLA
jgi:CRISPR-associated exonuclease Cas4